MSVRFLASLLLVSVFSLLVNAAPAWAQWKNIDTVEGPYGEETTLTKTPHKVAEGLSVRALGISASDTTRWALSLIGAAPEDTISVMYGRETLSIRDVDRPSGGMGPTKVFVSGEAFLTMAESVGVKVRVGNRTVSLPDQLRREMKQIFEQVN